VLEIESANIVLFGNFNPYLITPQWLKEQSIWAADDVQLALGAMQQDGVQFHGDGSAWYVSSDSLVISSTKLDCGSVAVKILEKLPHTPLTAVGSNFEFQDSSDSTQYPVFDEIRRTIPSELNSQLLRWGTVIHEDDVRIEVTFLSGEQGTTIALGYRRSASSIEMARRAASRYGVDRDKSDLLIDQILGRKSGQC